MLVPINPRDEKGSTKDRKNKLRKWVLAANSGVSGSVGLVVSPADQSDQR
jgi:hypothetical protein